MPEISLKVGPLQDRTPVKLNLSVEPELHADLQDYAAIHSKAFGKEVTATDLVPSMLRSLIDSDAGFKRARRALKTEN